MPPAGTVVVPKVEPNVNPVPVTEIGPVNVKLLVPVFVIVYVTVDVFPAETAPRLDDPSSKIFVPV